MKQRWRRKASRVCLHVMRTLASPHLRISFCIAQTHQYAFVLSVLQHCSVFNRHKTHKAQPSHHFKCQPFLFNYNWCALICHSVQVLSRCHIGYVNCSDDCFEWAYGWCMTGTWSVWLIAADGGTMNRAVAWGHQTAPCLHRHSQRHDTQGRIKVTIP